MEGRVIQNHDLSRRKRGTQLLLEPRLDERAVTVALEGERSQYLSGAPRRRHRDTLGSVPQPLAQAPGSSLAPAVGIVQAIVVQG